MQDRVYIQGPAVLPDEDYIIGSGVEAFTQYVAPTYSFTVVTQPQTHTLCGAVTI